MLRIVLISAFIVGCTPEVPAIVGIVQAETYRKCLEETKSYYSTEVDNMCITLSNEKGRLAAKGESTSVLVRTTARNLFLEFNREKARKIISRLDKIVADESEKQPIRIMTAKSLLDLELATIKENREDKD